MSALTPEAYGDTVEWLAAQSKVVLAVLAETALRLEHLVAHGGMPEASQDAEAIAEFTERLMQAPVSDPIALGALGSHRSLADARAALTTPPPEMGNELQRHHRCRRRRRWGETGSQRLLRPVLTTDWWIATGRKWRWRSRWARA